MNKIILILFLSSPLLAEWDGFDYTLTSTLLIGKVIEIGQTNYAIQKGGQELNPLFGKHPSKEKIYIYQGILSGIFLPICNAVVFGCVLFNYKQIQINLTF
ncbi:MAG: hypothetical protein ACW96U_00800 [Candidatus Heimdallarchaeaceae archaeon]|jgi:hypothetical protein